MATQSNDQPAKAPTTLSELDSFIFEHPLYEPLAIDPSSNITRQILWMDSKVDGYCPYCSQDRPFEVSTPLHGPSGSTPPENYVQLQRGKTLTLTATCTRHNHHRIEVHLRFGDGRVTKVGQWPSLASVLLEELKPIRSAVSEQDRNELHKAIGLAAHGVGVGSYVYLRRVFERMIGSVFDRHQTDVGLSPATFATMRIADKIDALKKHLPPLMVQSRSVYGRLSDGIHNLDEAECLKLFDVFKRAIFMMLRQEADRRAELAEEKALRAELQKLGVDTDDETEPHEERTGQ
jgi:hypothetical protein